MLTSIIALEVVANNEPGDHSVIRVGASVIELSYAPGEWMVAKDDIRLWISQSAAAIAGFYRKFPVTKLHVMITPKAGNNISGVAYRGIEPLIMISLGAGVDRETLLADWVAAHEMVHLAFPPVHRRHHWIEEGLATYVEPLARSRAGLLSEEEVWRWLVKGTPNGLPQVGDKGLDHTPTWGRTYWGGALFCLLADIEIRRRTDNRFALDDALRAIVAAGGTMQDAEDLWPLSKAFEIGDQAIGAPVLLELYNKMKAAPVDVDLDNLWRRLGVTFDNQTMQFDDNAPLAELRRAMTLTSHSGAVNQ
jgi:hypothetical protein